MEIIQAVLAHYDVWNGQKEREYIRSQQRAPEPAFIGPNPRALDTVTLPRKAKIRTRVLDVLEGGGWMSSHDVAVVTGITWKSVRQALGYLVRTGHVRVKRPDGRGNWTQPQQYRRVYP